MCLNPLYYLNPKKIPFKIFAMRFRSEYQKSFGKVSDYEFERIFAAGVCNEKGFLTDYGRELLHTWRYMDIGEYMQELPCRKCIECRQKQAREWSARCKLEAMQHDSNFFVTLTYDDKHCPKYEDGLLGLNYRDFQLFMKRLRKAIDYPIRYRVRAEYGERTRRPHYHAIIFGLKLHDLRYLYSEVKGRKIYQDNRGGHAHYTSKWLADIWQNGQIDVAAVEYGSIAYVNDYMLKFDLDNWKPTEEQAVAEYVANYPSQQGCYRSAVKLGVIPPPSMHQSTRPAIGAAAYEDLKQVLLETDAYPSGLDLRVRYIRYFDRKLFEEFPDLKEPRLRARANLAKAVAYDPPPDVTAKAVIAWEDDQKKRRGERLMAAVRARNRSAD